MEDGGEGLCGRKFGKHVGGAKLSLSVDGENRSDFTDQ